MAQGRGSAFAAAALALLCLLAAAEAATYTVGDRGGWGFNSNTWTKGKRFRAGDVLLFKYNPSAHNVVAVGAAGYRNCATPKRAKTFTSGGDLVKLARGTNYFICSFSGHCQAGMKIAVTAA